MGMTDHVTLMGIPLCGTEDFRTDYPEPKSYFLRFSDKLANGFLLNNLTGLLKCWPVIFIVKKETLTIYT